MQKLEKIVPAYWQQACKEISAADPVMKKIIKGYKGEALTYRGDAFYTLARSIVGQQISVKAADSVWARFVALFPEVHPRYVLTATPESMRAVGLSGSKVLYINEIAKFFEAHNHDPVWEKDDEALIKRLTAIKGVGRWTVEMFLIFHFLKPNILPMTDLGLLKGVYLHYNGGNPMPKEDVIKIADAWQPWRTVATWYLWRSLDPVPVEY